MGHLLVVLFQTVRRNLLLFGFIVLVLASGKWIQGQWSDVQGFVDELPALRSAQQDVSGQQAALARDIAERVARFSGAGVQQLDAEIAALDAEITGLQRERDTALLPSAAFKGAGAIAEQLRQQATRTVDIELRRQARDHLLATRAHLLVLQNRQAARDKLAQLRLSHVGFYAAFLRKQAQLARVRADAGALAHIPFTRAHRQVEQLKKDSQTVRAANNRAHADYLAQRALLERIALPAVLSQFRVDDRRLDQAAAALRERLARAENLAAHNVIWRAWQAVRPVLPAALALLIGWWLVPAAIRTLFYFVLAPLAARRPPMVFGTAPGAAPVAIPDSARFSAVSHKLMLAPGHELMIRPDYCQSQPEGVAVATTLLFDWRHAITSIAAHLWMLKRIRSSQGADIVVSATADALDEVAILELAQGQVFVLQPRALVGMLYRSGQRPQIRSHWRLGTLHAWLTLQLRYLAFDGPATLIVKGCRGVRLESAAAGRTISQDATLGFSADAGYATVRAEPFIPYLRGRQALFHDQFHGPQACFLYEEVPRHTRVAAQARNPLEAMFDASLKAFGI